MIKKIHLLFENIISKFNNRYEYDPFCFALGYYESLKTERTERTVRTVIQKGKSVKSKYLNNVNSYTDFINLHGRQTDKNILNILMKNQQAISSITNIPTFSYIVNVNHSDFHATAINKDDIDSIVNMIYEYKDETQINLILHSLGGSTHAAIKIVKTLHNKFDKVNFLIPSVAYSAATMMCMSANKITMTPESSLAPFDVYYPSPETGKRLPIKTLMKCAKEARRAHNPLCIFIPKSLYSNWNGEMITDTLKNCKASSKIITQYPIQWLMKYMFKELNTEKEYLSRYVLLPFWKRFSKNGRKAHKIIKYFINTGEQMSHDSPIMFNDLKDSGLKVELADGELLELLRETSFLSKELFNDTTICKLFINNEKYHISYSEK